MLKQRLSGRSVARSTFGLAALVLCSGGLVACKKKPPPPLVDPDSSAESVASVPPPAPPPGPVTARCREKEQAGSFTIGEVAARHAPPREQHDDDDDAGSDEDDEVPEPFSVELGVARADSAGFGVAALRAVKGQSHALIALLKDDAASGKIVDLGAVHGDPDPPMFAAHGPDLVLAASDTDAGGAMLRVGLLRDARGAAQVSWGPEITGVRHDSTFALEVSGERALLAYAAETAGKIRVYGALVDPSNLKNKLSPEPLSASGADVDSPRLAPRKGGYWLAVARALDAPKSKPKKPRSDAGSDLGEEDSLLDIGTRRIEVQKLDAQGKGVSSALVVTAPGARPMSFDLASGADGSAYVAFRDDDSTPGAEGGALSLVHVRADGTFEKVELSGDLNGTGTPSLLVDTVDTSKVWLTAAGENGATWFARLAEHTTLSADGLVRGGDLIAARDGNLLITRSRGIAAELSLVTCSE